MAVHKHLGFAAIPNRPPSNLGHWTLGILWDLVICNWAFPRCPCASTLAISVRTPSIRNFEVRPSQFAKCQRTLRPSRTPQGATRSRANIFTRALIRLRLRPSTVIDLFDCSFPCPRIWHKPRPFVPQGLQALQGLRGNRTDPKIPTPRAPTWQRRLAAVPAHLGSEFEIWFPAPFGI
ncbi:MAG: hypothetical protein JWR69_551 [Pedosphaera sp.]|nr:hypothetical protein [Pedosphaera sp.]